MVLLLVIPPKQERRHDTYHALILIPATINTVAEQLALVIVRNVAPLWHQTQRTEADKLRSLEKYHNYHTINLNNPTVNPTNSGAAPITASTDLSVGITFFIFDQIASLAISANARNVNA